MDVKDKDDGTYLAEYTVPEQDYFSFFLSFLDGRGGPGRYTLSVYLRGAHIKGSPFVVQVTRCSP